ncbi:pyrroline-5-carboxylate reductase [compost metagenome]
MLDIIEQIEAAAPGIPHIVSVAASVEFHNMESLSTCKITRVIPSITSEIREGVTLMAHNSKVDEDSAKQVEYWFSTLGEVRLIQESDFEVGADLTSCAPGLFSAILHHYIEAGMRYSQFTRSDTEAMVLNTFKATLHLLIEKEWTLSEMISRVATTGGITEEGINALNRSLPDAFNEMFMATLNKHQVLKEKLKNR